MRPILLVQALFLPTASLLVAPSAKPFTTVTSSHIDDAVSCLFPKTDDAVFSSHGFLTSPASTAIKTAPHDGLTSGRGESLGRTTLTMRPILLVQALFLPTASLLVAPSAKPFTTVTSSHIDDAVSCLFPKTDDAVFSSHGFLTSPASTAIKTAPHDGLTSGRGESLGRTTLTMRPILLVQVSYNSTIRSDDRFLVVLPRPHLCLSIAYECLNSCKLLVCGDIEENPGPTVDEMFESILSGQQAIRADIASLKERLESTETAIHCFEQRLISLECSMTEVRAKTRENEETHAVATAAHDLLKLHHEKLVDLENRSRRSNLIVFGITEDPNETETTLREKVIEDVFKDKVGVDCVSVARIHRLGKRPTGRPVIAFFQDYTEKQALMKNAHKLKGSGISLRNDYCADTLRKRRLLWNSAKEEKDSGRKVWLVHDKIRVGGDLYIWDDVHNTRKLVAKRDDTEMRLEQAE
ncbi:uncharacterized protein LOC144094901 [Amblyomma americanum]